MPVSWSRNGNAVIPSLNPEPEAGDLVASVVCALARPRFTDLNNSSAEAGASRKIARFSVMGANPAGRGAGTQLTLYVTA